MSLILGAQSATATGFSIDNSCRFDQGSSAFLNLTFGTPTNGHIWNYSCWVKRTQLGTASADQTALFCDNGVPDARIYFREDDWRVDGYYGGGTGGYFFETTELFRDPSAWYHVCVLWDDTQTVADNRVKLYINGTQVTAFDVETQPNQNTLHTINSAIQHFIGRIVSSQYTNCYMAQACFVDGTVYTISDFGEFNEDSPTIWQPIDVSELTFGDNGFLLDFADSADLGKDVSGKGNDWTSNGLVAADQATDSPTNNFCVINVLDNFYADSTFSEGNCQAVTGTTSYTWNTGSIGVSTGKWYWETELDTEPSPGNTLFGVADRPGDAADQELGDLATTYAYLSSGRFRTNNSQTAADYTTYVPNDIVGFALNMDDNEITFYVNGVIVDAARPLTASGTGFYFPAWGDWLDPGTITYKANFGGCSAFTVSSANQDENGYGNFEYAPPSGYLAICTKNLGSSGG